MSSRAHHFPGRGKNPAQKAARELTGNPFFSYTYLDNTGATLCYRGKAVRVIRCPFCDEPLPGFANFCAACGETLTPSPTSTTARISRPRTLKVPHFFAVANEDDLSRAETMKFGERSSRAFTSPPGWSASPQTGMARPAPTPNSTLPLGQRASIGHSEEDIVVE